MKKLFHDILAAYVLYNITLFVISQLMFTYMGEYMNGVSTTDALIPAFMFYIGFAALFGIIFGRKISKRFRILSKSMSQVARGNLSVESHVGPKGDIGRLERAFEKMVMNLRLLDLSGGEKKKTVCVEKVRFGVSTQIFMVIVLVSFLLFFVNFIVLPRELVIYPFGLTTGLCTGTIFSYMLARSFNDRIGRMTRAINNISKGKLDTRVRDERSDEIGVLARAFNHMAGSLQHQIQELGGI